MSTTTADRTPCEKCAAPGLFCGLGSVSVDPAPCVRCDEPTKVRSRCGVARRAVCRVAVSRRKAATLPTSNESLAAWLMARGDLDYAGVRRAESLWREHMKGVEWRGPLTTATNILDGSLHYQGIPELPRTNLEALEGLRKAKGGVWNALSWLHTPADLPRADGWDLTGWDVNGQYLSAAAIELGTGDPDLIRDPAPAALKLPGWVCVTELHNAPWSIASRWKPGMWMPTPLVDYMRERGALVVMPQALVWPTHRRWLDPHVNLLRSARKAIIAAGDDPAAKAALDAVKAVYTRMFGGLLGSKKYNAGPTLRPDWRAAIIGTAQARMFRALDDVRNGHVVGFHVDAAWIVVPAGERPNGLAIPANRDLGKFKPSGRAHWTAELAEQHTEGQHETIRKALADEG